MIKAIRLTKRVENELQKIPKHILKKFRAWVDSVETDGLEETRKLKGLHDEPLHGKRKGQRSVRLSRAYRAIYSIKKMEVIFALVEEVNKHEY